MTVRESGFFLRAEIMIPSWSALSLRSGLGYGRTVYEAHALFEDEHPEVEPTDALVRANYAAHLDDVRRRIGARETGAPRPRSRLTKVQIARGFAP